MKCFSLKCQYNQIIFYNSNTTAGHFGTFFPKGVIKLNKEGVASGVILKKVG